MRRAAAYSLFVASLVTGSLLAQRVGGGFHGGSVSFTHSGAAAQRGFRGSVSVRPFSHHHNRQGFWYPYVFPYDGLYDGGEPYPEQVNQFAPAVAQTPAPQPAPIEPRVIEPKIIEVPGAANASAKPLPPTIFILTSGERLETHRYLLRANNLSVTINRRQRVIPLDELDLDSTIAANHDRGIDLEIPADPNEISLRF